MDIFSIDSTTSFINFKIIPDYDYPTDVNGDNVYVILIRNNLGSFVELSEIKVTVMRGN